MQRLIACCLCWITLLWDIKIIRFTIFYTLNMAFSIGLFHFFIHPNNISEVGYLAIQVYCVGNAVVMALDD